MTANAMISPARHVVLHGMRSLAAVVTLVYAAVVSL
jgi:hypothetical protein